MASRIEDYALIGDCETAALVGRDSSIDWLCFPRFDSAACLAALLGTREHGRWMLAPAVEVERVHRRYRPGTLVLESDYHNAAGVVRLIDFMPPRTRTPELIRMVEGVEGNVPMRLDLAIRFDYGSVVPWVRRTEQGIRATAGPEALYLRTPVQLSGEDLRTVAHFSVAPGDPLAVVFRVNGVTPSYAHSGLRTTLLCKGATTRRERSSNGCSACAMMSGSSRSSTIPTRTG